MALEYATITGKILDLTGTPIERQPVFIEAVANNGTIKDTLGKVVFRGRKIVKPDSLGNYSITLPKVPQADIDPGDAAYRLIFPASLRTFNETWRSEVPDSFVFTLTANTTWADLVEVAGADATESLISQLTALRDETVAAAGAVAYTAVQFKLRPFYEAVAKRLTQRVNILVLGDSISEGVLVGTPVYQKRWPDLLQAQLRSRLGLAAGGVGYMPAYYADSILTDDTTRGGGLGASPAGENSWIWGAGGKGILIPFPSGNAGTLTWPLITCTKVRVYYGKGTTGGGQSKVYVDGVDRTASGTLGGNGTSGASGANLQHSTTVNHKGGYWWEYTIGAAAAHTIRIDSTAVSSSAIITAVEFFNSDDASSIHVYDGAHSGAKASDYIQASMAPAQTEWTSIDPHLVIANFGTNGWSTDSAVDFQGYTTTLVSQIKTACPNAVIALVHGWRPGTAPQGTWDAYGAAKRAIADADAKVAMFDLSALWPALATDGSLNNGLMVESTNPVHPNGAGNQRLADIFASLLLPV